MDPPEIPGRLGSDLDYFGKFFRVSIFENPSKWQVVKVVGQIRHFEGFSGMETLYYQIYNAFTIADC